MIDNPYIPTITKIVIAIQQGITFLSASFRVGKLIEGCIVNSEVTAKSNAVTVFTWLCPTCNAA